MSMPVKDEGEFELILGNKQIMAVFFIVLLLMGLFFSIGYLAGKRSAGGEEKAAQQPSQVPITVDAAKRETPRGEPQQAAAREEAQPPAQQQEDRKPEPPQEARKEPAVPARLYVEQPPAGTYLQAAATQRADAEAMLSFIIGKTGLRGYVTPSPKSPELCRVLIGPLAGNEQMADARAKLGALGVTNAFPVKY